MDEQAVFEVTLSTEQVAKCCLWVAMLDRLRMTYDRDLLSVAKMCILLLVRIISSHLRSQLLSHIVNV